MNLRVLFFVVVVLVCVCFVYVVDFYVGLNFMMFGEVCFNINGYDVVNDNKFYVVKLYVGL